MLADIGGRSDQSARQYLSYFPANYPDKPGPVEAKNRPSVKARPVSEIVPDHQNTPFDMMEVIESLVDEGSFL